MLVIDNQHWLAYGLTNINNLIDIIKTRMSAAFLFPLFEAAGALIGGALEGAGVASASAEAAGSAAQGAISGSIGSQIDNAILNKIRDVIGPENVSKVSTLVTEATQVNNALNDPTGGTDPSAFSSFFVTTNQGPRRAQSSNVKNANAANGSTVSSTVSRTGINVPASNPGIISAPPSLMSSGVTNAFSTISNGLNNTITSLPGSVSDNYSNGNNNNSLVNISSDVIGNINTIQDNSMSTSDLAVVAAPVNSSIQSILPQAPKVIIDPADLGNYIVSLGSNIAAMKGDISTATSMTIGNDPVKASIAQRLSNYLSDKAVPVSNEYKAIAAVYNGRNIYWPQSWTEAYVIGSGTSSTGIITTYGTDELGVTVSLQPLQGMTIPTIHGKYVGPNSANIGAPIDLFDGFAFFHDYDYLQGGWFNRSGDMKFISRLSQNRDRFPSDQLNMINATIIYFSTVGLSLGTLVGSSTTDPSINVPTEVIKDDIFADIGTGDGLSDADYNVARYDFYKTLLDTINTAHSTTGIMAPGSAFRNQQLFNQFESMMIQIL
jgi:hypothetical protein